MGVMDNIGTSTFRRARTVVVNQSPFSGKVNRAGFQDWRWTFQFDYQLQTRLEAAPLLTLIAGQGEGVGFFGVFDPDWGTPLASHRGTGTCKTTPQTGVSVETTGWPANAQIALMGDRLFVQVGNSCQLFVVMANVTSTSVGDAVFMLDAPIRGATIASGIVGLIPALSPPLRLPVRLTGYTVSSQPGGLYSISISGEEIV